jgi:hypothetical protein
MLRVRVTREELLDERFPDGYSRIMSFKIGTKPMLEQMFQTSTQLRGGSKKQDSPSTVHVRRLARVQVSSVKLGQFAIARATYL